MNSPPLGTNSPLLPLNPQGTLAEVYLWGRPLEDPEVAVIARGFNYLEPHLKMFAALLAVFPLEEGRGEATGEALTKGEVLALFRFPEGPVWVRNPPPDPLRISNQILYEEFLYLLFI